MMPLSMVEVGVQDGGVTRANQRGGMARRQRRQAGQPSSGEPEGPVGGPTTLLFVDPDDGQRLTSRSDRGWARFLARLLACSLDRRLAHGDPPESSRLLAVRAHLLVSPATCRALIQNWQGLLLQASTPTVMRDPRIPFNRDRVIACEPDIEEMLGALSAPLPIPARGVAMASWLLTDGTGPLYDRRRSDGLAAVLRETIAQLDPARSLVPTA